MVMSYRFPERLSLAGKWCVLAVSPCQLSAISHDDLDKLTVSHAHLTRRLWLSTVIDGAVHRSGSPKWAGETHIAGRLT